MSFTADYPGSIVVPSHPDNYYRPEDHGGVSNKPRALFLHTPEEPVDNNEVTPRYFSRQIFVNGVQRFASTHYYADSDGDWYQMVPERCAAIANGLDGKPLPRFAIPGTSLNWQSLSVEIEGFASNIHQTCKRGGPQWNSIVKWVENRTRVHGIPLDRDHVLGHYQVSVNRTDPGQLDINAIVEDAKKLREGDLDMATAEELQKQIDAIKAVIYGHAVDAADVRAASKALQAIAVNHENRLRALGANPNINDNNLTAIKSRLDDIDKRLLEAAKAFAKDD